jgi:hypothetical protein
VLYKWNAAIAWLALFRSEDFLEQPYYPFGSDSESFPGLYLVTNLSEAIRNLDQREPKLAQLFGSPWTDNIAEFRRYLTNPRATHVELNASELLDDDNQSDVVRENLDEYIRTLDEPLFSGSKKLFSREPKRSRSWSRIRKEVQGLTTGELSPWVLFGARENWSWWSDAS